MKKLLVIALAMLLVMGVSAVGLAADSDTQPVSVNIAPYFNIWFDTDNNPDYLGLFGNDSVDIGQPGIYISDGNTTRTSVLGIWDPAITAAEAAGIESGEVYEQYFDEGQLPTPQVELFKVDANTVVDVTLSADFDYGLGWMNAPTLFRVSSDATEINGIGDWVTDLAVVGNTVTHVNNGDYNDLLDAHNTAVNALVSDGADTFTLDFAQMYLCSGPLEFHLNGALWIPKASQVAAGDYEAEVMVTVAATPSS